MSTIDPQRPDAASKQYSRLGEMTSPEQVGDTAAQQVVPTPARRRRADVVLGVGILGLGVVLGLSWWALLGPAERASETAEVPAASDVVFILLSMVAAVLTLLRLWWQAGGYDTTRFVIAMVASALGSVLAVGVGRLCGAHGPETWASLLVWPLIVALGTALPAIGLSFRDGEQ